MQSIAIAVCTLLGLGMLLFGSDFLDRRLIERAGGVAPSARRDAAALVTAALTPMSAPPATRPDAGSSAGSSVVESTPAEAPATVAA